MLQYRASSPGQEARDNPVGRRSVRDVQSEIVSLCKVVDKNALGIAQCRYGTGVSGTIAVALLSWRCSMRVWSPLTTFLARVTDGLT